MIKSRTDNNPHWYVAYVRSCQEKRVAQALDDLGFVNYLPVIREVHKWSDRKKVVDRLVLPRIVFIRCLERERVSVLKSIPTIYSFLVDRCTNAPAIVRDGEMETFRSMVAHGVGLSTTDQPFAPGDRVRVISGPFVGCEFELVSVSGKSCLVLRLGALGSITMEIPAAELEKIS